MKVKIKGKVIISYVEKDYYIDGKPSKFNALDQTPDQSSSIKTLLI